MLTLQDTEPFEGYGPTHTVLARLLNALRDTPFRAIRYYHYESAQERIVSIDSAGMPAQVADALRAGGIIKFRSSTPLSTHDSFWCFRLREAVLFIVNKRRAKKPLRPRRIVPGIKGIYLPRDECRRELKGHKTSKWVDCPLLIGGRCIGKLSCDLSPRTPVDSKLQAAVNRLWALAQATGPALELSYRESLQPLTDIRDEIAECDSLDSLFKYCTETMARRHFRCRYASLFTYSRDLFGSSRLILRKTSFPGLKPKVNKAFYDLSEKALTTWVANHGQSLRLHSLDDVAAMAEQLRAYGRGIVWHNKYQDSPRHNTFLAVPLGTKKSPLGVIRYTDKMHGRFTESEQVLLERVCRDYLAPRLHSLARSEFVPALVNQLQDMHAVSLSFASGRALPQQLCDAMERCFPERDGRQKLYLINCLAEDGRHFRHYAIGGSLLQVTSPSHLYPVAGSFTGHVMRHGVGRAVLVIDCNRAHASGGFHIICPSAVCALGSPLVLRGSPFGALVVMSDSHDLLEPSHAHFLAILAGEVSQLFGLRRLLDVSSGLLGMRHDCGTILNTIEAVLDEPAEGWRQEVSALVRFLLETVDTYCRPGPGNPHDFATYECTLTNVRDEVLLAAKAAKYEVGSVSGMECRIDEDLEVKVHPTFLMSILYNLIKNAWGATPGCGRPVIACARTNEGYLEISLVDQGRGMKKGVIEQYNTQDPLLLSGPPHRRVKGMGILVAQRIAAWHLLPDGRRGEVKIRSGPHGVGTCVSLRLPVVD